MIRGRIVLTLLVGAGCGALYGAEPELPDEELLEFIGSWEGEDDQWQEFFDNWPDVSEDTLPVDEQNDRRSDGERD